LTVSLEKAGWSDPGLIVKSASRTCGPSEIDAESLQPEEMMSITARTRTAMHCPATVSVRLRAICVIFFGAWNDRSLW
jgi:hypothetical protein